MVLMATKTILLIDDEIHVREIIQLCLKDLGGWDVLTVNSPIEGLLMAARSIPDAIVLDSSIAGMDSFFFLEDLRSNPVTESIPVVLLSGKARWLNSQILRYYRVAGAIAKPFDPITLCSEIAKLLDWDFPNNSIN